MSKRNELLIVIGAVFVANALLSFSTAARAGLAVVLFVVAIVIVVRVLIKSRLAKLQSERVDNSAESGAVPDTFALGKLFEATMSGMREGLLVVDKDMRVVASNAAAHRLFNLSQGKLDAQRLTELTRNPAIYSAFLDALNGTEQSGVKVETHGPERLVFDLRVVPLPNSPNSPGSNGRGVAAGAGQAAEGALGVFIDVTRMERLEHVRQEFLSNVSHELRTPLTAILAFIETLEAGALDDKEASHRFLEIIRRNATRMHELITDILELSAIEAGNVTVKAEEIELAPLVTDVIASLSTQASEQAVVLNNFVPRDAKVFADARRLEQMLTNLVENAIKFNRENGSVTIRYEMDTNADSTSGSAVNGQRSAVIVEDTGEGIPAQHLERLFERFYRVDRARSRDMGGTGLGLAIVKHLARAHGGEVSVSSELGKGSTFTIELPNPSGPKDR